MKKIATTLFKRAPSIIQNNFTSSCHIAQRPIFYSTKILEDDTDSGQRLEIPKAAQAALLDYLHSTRSLPFLEAEYMSKNSSCFLINLLKRVAKEEAAGDADIGSSLTRFLRYHPVNEFEPFFESMGLNHSEYCDFLPRDFIFLSDHSLLLENYLVLCDYGIPRNKLGRIYKEATEVFQYHSGDLHSKLIEYEKFGLSESSIIKIVATSPCILMTNGKKKFLEFCEVLKRLGIECDWIGKHLEEGNSCLWNPMLELLSLLSKMGCSNAEQSYIISQHPDILFKDSAHMAFLVIGFVSKFGATPHEILSLFVNFPNIPVEEFIHNMWNCYQFLGKLKMDSQEIGLIVCLYPEVLGSCKLRKVSTLMQILGTGRKQLCELIKNDPLVLKNWVLGVRMNPLLKKEDERSQMLKTQFLLGLGFVKDSSEMKRALKSFRGNKLKLQERFDCLVHAGLSAEDVTRAVRTYPPILNQSKEVLIKKIDLIVNGLSYPVSCLIKCPSVLNYTIRKVHCRLSMYNWLKEQGRVVPNLALTYLLSISETIFKRRYVHIHPGGPEHWEKLMKDISST